MSITIFEPLRSAATMNHSVRRMMEKASDASNPMPVDVMETAEALVVRATLPGADKDAIEISFHEGQLTIRAQIQPTRAGEKQRLLLRERRAGALSRTLAISVPVDADQAAASYNDGVLTLTLPKASHARARRIAIA